MGRCDAAPSDKGLARGKPMVDPNSSSKGRRVAFAAWPLQSEGFAPRHVRHPDALMGRQIPRDSRSPSRRQVIRRCHQQTPGLAEHLWQTTMDKLAVDQPNYASYKRELGNK